MAVVATATSIGAPRIHSSAITFRHRQQKSTDNAIRIRRKSFGFEPRVATASSACRHSIVTASKSPNEGVNSNADEDDPDTSFSFQEDDLSFLLKLGAGSFAGAAAIKYGSILVPEITWPNITQALIMISAPVVVSVLLLIKQSRIHQ